jgi:acyl carrier protein phosphodiesterase
VNWLAHLRVAPPEPLPRLGNLLGDFVRGVDVATLPAPVRAGIAQHRAVDRFTDAHARFRRSRALVPAPLRRFSGVLVDVFYDHFLARDWHRFGDRRPLAAFTADVYALLAAHHHLLPPRLRHAAPHMAREDWLGSYAAVDGIELVLTRMAARLRRPSPLADGATALRAHYAALGNDFAAFFPDLLAFATALPAAAADRPAAARDIDTTR